LSESVYPAPSRDLAAKRRELAPDIQAAFDAFGQRVFADGALPAKTKQLIAVAVAHVTQCPYCIRGHRGRSPSRRDSARADGGDLGCRGDAGGRRLRPYRYLVDCIGGGTAARPDLKGVEGGYRAERRTIGFFGRKW
jgi:hypothetical protein